MKAAMGLAFAADVPLMASTFCNRYGQRRLRMGSEPPAEEWEQTFGAETTHHAEVQEDRRCGLSLVGAGAQRR